MTPAAIIDFETRSTCDLIARGLANYARHPDTRPWCMSWAFRGTEPKTWRPERPDPAPLLDHIKQGGIVVAHNAAFEIEIWNRVCVLEYGWPKLRPEQVRCTMAMCYAMALPGKLEAACAALGLSQLKDMDGHRLMLQMCRPKTWSPVTWWDDEGRIGRLCAYCEQDVRAEMALLERVVGLSDRERSVWALDYAINARGFGVDLEAVADARRLVLVEQTRIQEQIYGATDGAVPKVTQLPKLKNWLAERGYFPSSLGKDSIAELLEDEDLPGEIRLALEARREGGKASTSKLDTIATRATGRRIMNSTQYHGAGTGRWAGRDVQPHNFIRDLPKPAEVEQIMEFMHGDDRESIALFYGPPMDVVPRIMRGLIVAADGKILRGGDYSNIEGRGVAWAAGEQWKLDAFRRQDEGTGPDNYNLAYAKAYGVPVESVTDAQRQIGKIMELAFGYEGGVGAVQKFAKGKLKVTDAEAERWKIGWRDAHPQIVQWWKDLKWAAMYAVDNPGRTFECGPPGRKVRFKVAGSFLWCRLQSGRTLCYPYPKLGTWATDTGTDENALLYKTVNAKQWNEEKQKWIRVRWGYTNCYGGSLAENIIQAICRDILAEAMLRLAARGYSIVLHVHDEIVTEDDPGFGSLRDFESLMTEESEWAAGWPIHVKAWEAWRYGKA